MRAPTPSKRPAPRAHQRGAALFVAMIMLLMLLMLGVVGMRTVTLESRIAGNMLEAQRLQETADGSLREGERIIEKKGIALSQCTAGAEFPGADATPCYVSEARIDELGLNTDFGVSAKASGFEKPSGYWYPRYVSTVCPKGSSATSALEAASTGCTEFYELNAQATFKADAQDCGTDALCLRSTINLFIK